MLLLGHFVISIYISYNLFMKIQIVLRSGAKEFVYWCLQCLRASYPDFTWVTSPINPLSPGKDDGNIKCGILQHILMISPMKLPEPMLNNIYAAIWLHGDTIS